MHKWCLLTKLKFSELLRVHAVTEIHRDAEVLDSNHNHHLQHHHKSHHNINVHTRYMRCDRHLSITFIHLQLKIDLTCLVTRKSCPAFHTHHAPLKELLPSQTDIDTLEDHFSVNVGHSVLCKYMPYFREDFNGVIPAHMHSAPTFNTVLRHIHRNLLEALGWCKQAHSIPPRLHFHLL